MRRGRVAASFAAVFVGSWLALCASPARACSPAWPVPELTGSATSGLDSTPPIILDVTVDRVVQGEPDSENPCPDQLFLRVVAEDDQTPADSLRYRVEDTSTTEPYWLFDEPVRYFFVVPPVDALRIYALDDAGNQSAPFAFSLDEGEDEGCSMARGSASRRAPTLAVGMVVALVWFARRRTC